MVVAERLGRFDTIGIDCIAMNVNDLICVGAEPIAMLDFILCSERRPRGLRRDRRGAARAAPSWPGSRSPAARSPRWATSSRAGSWAAARSAWSSSTRSSPGDAIEPGDAADRPPLLRPSLERLHAGPPGARRRPARRRAPRPAARRRAARADRDLRARDPRAAALAASTSAGSPTSPATGSTTCCGSRARSATRSTTRFPCPPVFDLIAGARRRRTPRRCTRSSTWAAGSCCVVADADEDAALELLRGHHPGH